MSTKISVIIPTYAPKEYLWECLNSLENQTLSKEEFEVIIVLNGNRQPYEDLIASKVGEHSFNCHLLYSTSVGVSAARNLGMRHAKGCYVCFLDDDDWVSSNYLEGLLAKACQDGIVESNVKLVDEETKQEIGQHYLGKAFLRYKPSKATSHYANRSFFSSSCCKLIPVKCITNQLFDTHIKRGEDSIFMFAISWNIKRIMVAEPSCIYYIRRRKNSAGTCPIGFCTKMLEFVSQSVKYTVLYVKYFTHYEFCFYLSRIAGTFYNKFIQH